MKKIYLLAFSVLAGSGLFAQVALNGYSKKIESTRENISPRTPNRVDEITQQNGMRVVILEENFQGVIEPFPGVLPAGWSTPDVVTTDPAGTEAAFRVHNTTTANAGSYWPVAAIGTGNLFAGANDDAPPCNCDMAAIYLEAPSVSFATAANPAVTFDIYNDGNFGAGDAFVSVSIDGGTTYDMINYPLDDAGLLPLEEGNWQTIVLTLFDYATESDVRIRFNWADGGEWASGFAVDNVVIGDLDEFSLKMDKVVFGDWNQVDFALGFWDYTKIPLTQTSPVHATSVVSNLGYGDLNNLSMSIDVLQGVTSQGIWSTDSPDPLLSLTKDTISVVSDYSPDALGQYTIMAGITSDETEVNITDNAAMNTFEMTEGVYARDMGAAQAFMLLDNGGDFSGNLFDIYENEDFLGIQFAVGAGTTVGASLTGFIFEFQGFDGAGDPIFEFVDNSETEEVIILESALNSVGEANFTCLPFASPVTLEQDLTYLVVVSSTDVLRVPVSGSNVWVTSWNFSGNAFGATSGVPMIRLIGTGPEAESCIIGIDESEKNNVTLGQNMPNPANSNTLISYVLNGSSKVVLSVRDIAGQIVGTYELGNKSIGKHSYELDVKAFAPGLYTYTINAGSTNITKKMIVD